MKILPVFAAVGVCVATGAQSPLDVFPVAPVGYFGWQTPSPNHQTFFDLSVSTPVTLQAIDTPLLTPTGQIGTLEVWLTTPGTTTHFGNEANPAVWTQVATGLITGQGTTGGIGALTARACLQAVGGGGLLLVPGNYGVAIRYTNCNPLLVGVGVLQTFTNAELSVSGGAMQYTAWGGVQAPATAQGYNAWCWRGSLIYENGVFPHACAEATPYGIGCNTVVGSFYQEFANAGAAAAAAAALNGRSLTLIPAGTSYIVIPGTATYIPPSPAATALPATDDGEAPVQLTIPFLYPGGVATDLHVHSNGFVSVAPNTVTGNNQPEIDAFLNASETAWYSWHNYNPTEPGSGLIKFEEVGSLALITWDGVESYPTTAANPSTFQFQFDSASGQVNYVWVSIDPTGNSGILQFDDHLIGFSPGGPSPDGGPINIPTLTSLTLNYPEALPLVVSTSAKPLIGTTINIDTARETGFSVGINFVSVTQIPSPGIDLGIIGAPGCPALIDVNAGVGNVISNLGTPGLSMSVAFALPNSSSLAGLSIYSQSVWLDPSANPFGATVSNGLELLLGNF